MRQSWIKNTSHILLFAEEKLDELSELKKLAEDENYKGKNEFIENKELFEADRSCTDENVRKRLENVKDSDYIRLPERTKRQALQRQVLGLKNFPTTTIGSFPQTIDVKKNRTAFKKGEITLLQYKEFNKKKIKECIEFQEEIGLDVLVHGEYERNDMVEYFGESLAGFLFTEKSVGTVIWYKMCKAAYHMGRCIQGKAYNRRMVSLCRRNCR